jgi:hypothetical protein
MSFFGRVLFLLFAVVALNAHGVANIIDRHDINPSHSHEHGAAHLKSASSVHVHQHQSEAAGGVLVDHSSAAENCDGASCEPQGEGHSGSHFHVPCCGTFMALLPAIIGLRMFDTSKVEQSMGRASLALGELRYPLLRPPAG